MEDAIGIIKNFIAFRVNMEKKIHLLLTCSNLKNNHRVVSLMCLSALEKILMRILIVIVPYKKWQVNLVSF